MLETHHVAASVGAVFLCAVVGFSLSQPHVDEAFAESQLVTVIERDAVSGYHLKQANLAAAVAAEPTEGSLALAETPLVPLSETATAVEEDNVEASPVVPLQVEAAEVVDAVSHSEPRVDTQKAQTSFTTAVIDGIHQATNAARKREGRDAFVYDTALSNQAAAYSEVMLQTDSLSHTDASGCTMTCRFKASGYKAATWGENLAVWKSSYEPTVDEVVSYFVAAWLRSDGHRDNLLSTSFTHQGIGIAREGNTIYVTVHFAKP